MCSSMSPQTVTARPTHHRGVHVSPKSNFPRIALLCSSGFSAWGRGLLIEEMKLEAVVVTEVAAEEEESRKAFVKTVHITALHTNTRPTQLR